MSLRLSFIVPFYNVESYIEECIRSLYAQDIPWEDYEVICVDDCSPDGSRAIVERLQKEYPTLKLLTTPENLRQGGARNLALKEAKGKYVSFVDSDDYFRPNSVNKLLTLAENENLDILDFDFDTDKIGIQNGMQKNRLVFTTEICTGTEYVFNSYGLWANRCCCVCAMLIRRTFLDENNLRFVEKMQYEDTDFSIQMFANAERIKHVGEKVYFYRYTFNSATHGILNTNSVYYRVELIKRYVSLFHCINNNRWKIAIREIIWNEVYQLLVDLRKASCENQYFFYKQHLGKICGINLFVGKKIRMALKSKLFLYLFFRKK